MVDIQLITNITSSLNNYKVSAIKNEKTLIQTIYGINPILIFIDNNVLKHNSFFSEFNNLIVIDAVEKNKSYDNVENIIDIFSENQVKKNNNIIVIGGGILQDLIGYCCSIYARGIKYFLFPTTLLSMCDSCIGGKTSINYKSKKNLIGTFYPPVEIFIYYNFINSLTEFDFLSGIGEIFKFYCLQKKIDEFLDLLHLLVDKISVDKTIIESLKYKSNIIEIDEFDLKERKFLNFGHTFGHAFESTSNFTIPHGSAVVLGIWIAYLFSLKKEYYVDNKQLNNMHEISKKMLNHIDFQYNWFNFKDLLNVIKSDKKNTGKIIMILPVKNDFNLIEFNEIELENHYNFAKEIILKNIRIK